MKADNTIEGLYDQREKILAERICVLRLSSDLNKLQDRASLGPSDAQRRRSAPRGLLPG